MKNLQPNKMDFMLPNKTLRTTQYASFNVKSKRFSFQVGTYLNINTHISMLDLNIVME